VPDGAYRSQGGPGVIEAVDASLPVLKDAGATILPTASPDITRLNELSRRILSFEAAMVHRLPLMSRPDDYSGEIRARLEPGLGISPQDYAEALRLREAILADWLETAMRGADLVHVPTLPVTAPSLEEAGRMAAGAVPAINARITANTMGINYLGLPALAVPCGFVEGLPVSFQLVGRAYGEDLLLRVAHAYQLRRPWLAEPPVLGAM
jgi:aspartyl-tRNA(Asn)/glutamyl-tRNA(Gln) amidotransferase subunit A